MKGKLKLVNCLESFCMSLVQNSWVVITDCNDRFWGDKMFK